MDETLLAFLFIFVISIAGLKLKSLTRSGAIAACFVGSAIFLGFGYPGLILLGLFFGSSSLWSKFKRDQKKSVDDLLEKGEQRDVVQVLANGGIPALVGILNACFPFNGSDVVFAASIAAANADTWASEIGTLSKQMPRMIFTMKKAKKGTSGAVSALGTSAAAAGAFLIGITSYLFFQMNIFDFWVIFFLGFMGNMIDTILGASIQVQFQCPECGKKTERSFHCDTNGMKIRGFLNNDGVNFLSILLTALLACFFI